MNLPRRQRIRLAAVFTIGWLSFCQAHAQIPANPPAAPQSDVSLPSLAPAVPAAKSPVSFFRELLAMTPAEQQQALANRPAENQRAILAKVAQYEAMPADDRELRLRATELWWYLAPLLTAPATNRAALLNPIPADIRKLVEDRLDQWQILPPPLKEGILADDQKLQLYLQLTGARPPPQPELLKLYPPGMRDQLETEVQRVNPFFELTQEEKEKVLATLSEPERRQMEAALRAFEKLPSEQRDRCIRAFGKFASMSARERLQFLSNAERWQAMTPAERERWRDLVRDVPQWPPLPPGLEPSAPTAQSSPFRRVIPVGTNRIGGR